MTRLARTLALAALALGLAATSAAAKSSEDCAAYQGSRVATTSPH